MLFKNFIYVDAFFKEVFFKLPKSLRMGRNPRAVKMGRSEGRHLRPLHRHHRGPCATHYMRT